MEVYNLREIEFLFLISYISIICKFIQTLFGSIYYIHSFNKNVCGLGTEALGSYVKWQILSEYFSMYSTVLSFLPSNTSFQLWRVTHCSTVLVFDGQFSADPFLSFSSLPQNRYKYCSLWQLWGWLWNGNGFGLVVWRELQKMRNEHTDVISY